jgi:hypothetical protein
MVHCHLPTAGFMLTGLKTLSRRMRDAIEMVHCHLPTAGFMLTGLKTLSRRMRDAMFLRNPVAHRTCQGTVWSVTKPHHHATSRWDGLNACRNVTMEVAIPASGVVG